MAKGQSPFWWEEDGLRCPAKGWRFSGLAIRDVVKGEETPAYLYDFARVQANVTRLRTALERLDQPTRLFYAMKSNRFRPLLEAMARAGNHGIDACSIREAERAVACGFLPGQITFTAHGVARREWEQLLRWPDLWVNADSLSDLEKIGTLAPGRTIGLRLNPAVGVGYRENPRLLYATGTEVTKFGLRREEIHEALRLAQRFGLRVEGLHVHSGCGYLTPQLPAFEQVLTFVAEVLTNLPQIKHVNLGGGLGIPLRDDDAPLDLDAWAMCVRTALADFGGEIWIEPGDYLVKDAGVLVVEVTQVLPRGSSRLVTVNAGFNVHHEPVFYDLPLHVVPVEARPGPWETATVAGNLNEVQDLWAKDLSLPPLEEGDLLAMFNAGGYGASMASDHCLRGHFTERLLGC